MCLDHSILSHVDLLFRVCVCLRACAGCGLNSQNGSRSLMLLSRFTVMLMWDFHQNVWCRAQTEPMSQLESLRNSNTHTRGDTQSPLIPSQRLTILLSQMLLHIHNLLHFLSCAQTHKKKNAHTPLHPPGIVPLAFTAAREKNAEIEKIKKWEQDREWASEEKEPGAASQMNQPGQQRGLRFVFNLMKSDLNLQPTSSENESDDPFKTVWKESSAPHFHWIFSEGRV